MDSLRANYELVWRAKRNVYPKGKWETRVTRIPSSLDARGSPCGHSIQTEGRKVGP